MRCCGRSQADRDEVLDDCCHMISALRTLHSKGHIIIIAEAENYWFATYLNFYKEKLGIDILFIDTYFLITKDGSVMFDIAGFQTDHIFNIRIEVFMNKKDTKIIKAKFKVKS